MRIENEVINTVYSHDFYSDMMEAHDGYVLLHYICRKCGTGYWVREDT